MLVISGRKYMITELVLVHRMLAERVSGFEYLSEWRKVLQPYSWEIFRMRNRDQREWNRIKRDVDSEMRRIKSQADEYLKIDEIQQDNTKRLKKIVSEVGCVTISRFGLIASHCAWLIVQHSDHDKDFQNEYLKLMRENIGDVDEQNYKWLRMKIKGK